MSRRWISHDHHLENCNNSCDYYTALNGAETKEGAVSKSPDIQDYADFRTTIIGGALKSSERRAVSANLANAFASKSMQHLRWNVIVLNAESGYPGEEDREKPLHARNAFKIEILQAFDTFVKRSEVSRNIIRKLANTMGCRGMYIWDSSTKNASRMWNINKCARLLKSFCQ